MRERPTRIDSGAAREDLEHRTLAKLASDFARLVFLASTRDYNSGRYYHDGLAFHFNEAAAWNALATAHREVFFNLTRRPLEDFVSQFERYAHSASAQSSDLLRTWDTLEPYRILIPADCNPLTAEYFVSNVKMALAILQARQSPASQDEQSA